MGNSDQSLNSEHYQSYQRQCSGGSAPILYHHDSGLYDQPHYHSYPTPYSNGPLALQQRIPRGPAQDTHFFYTEAHMSYPGRPLYTSPGSHTHSVSSQPTPDSSHDNGSHTSSYSSHMSEESGFDNESTEVHDICPYAIAHSSAESESEGVHVVCVCVWRGGWMGDQKEGVFSVCGMAYIGYIVHSNILLLFL